MKILLATANVHKLKEIKELLGDLHIEVFPLTKFPDIALPEETGATMRENARLKAEHCACKSNLPSLADDSGIEVDALDGAPGVRSARWISGSDEARTSALLQKLNGVPDNKRNARYRCAICLAYPSGEILETEATCEGRVGYEMQGENGFGYDPIFVISEATGAPQEYIGLTMAQVPPEIKAQVSHRARALMKLRELLSR